MIQGVALWPLWASGWGGCWQWHSQCRMTHHSFHRQICLLPNGHDYCVASAVPPLPSHRRWLCEFVTEVLHQLLEVGRRYHLLLRPCCVSVGTMSSQLLDEVDIRVVQRLWILCVFCWGDGLLVRWLVRRIIILSLKCYLEIFNAIFYLSTYWRIGEQAMRLDPADWSAKNVLLAEYLCNHMQYQYKLNQVNSIISHKITSL